MTAEDRVKAVVEFGFTERQARFLVTVMLHSGVCLLRQYTAFAGIVHGQKTRKFFDKLVSRKFATAYPCSGSSCSAFNTSMSRVPCRSSGSRLFIAFPRTTRGTLCGYP